jgi:hypothetical protein
MNQVVVIISARDCFLVFKSFMNYVFEIGKIRGGVAMSECTVGFPQKFLCDGNRKVLFGG